MGKYFDKNTALKVIEFFVLLKRTRQAQSEQYETLLLNSYLEFYFTHRAKYELIEYYIDGLGKLPLEYSSDTELWCEKVRTELIELSKYINLEQKYQLAFTCFEYLQFIEGNVSIGADSDCYNEIGDLIINCFKLEKTVCIDVQTMLANNFALIKNTDNLMVVGRFKHHQPKSYSSIEVDDMEGKLWLYYVSEIDCFVVKYIGNTEILLNSHILNSDCVYQLNKGGIISYKNKIVVSYSQLKANIIQKRKVQIELKSQNLSFTYDKSNQGVKPISLQVNGGELLAVMGGSGTGKTTLLSLLSGRIRPNEGEVFINGSKLYNNAQNVDLFKQIGFVPQIDLLNEDLTVEQNLCYSAQLSRNNLSKAEKNLKVDRLLKDLGLSRSKKLKVGTAVDKVISGGQRKRLNIALELIREPSILFVDEPSSGLSSKDAFQVIKMLREIANQGKIVVINIHQPTSEIFHLFDKLVIMDKDGYPVYFGEPFYAASYFKKHLNLIDSAIDDSMQIGYYNPEQIIDLIEYEKLDENGNPVNDRVFSPSDWHRLFLRNVNKVKTADPDSIPLPEVGTEVPGFVKQMVIYFRRNLVSRFADQSYFIFTLLGAPILALIISCLLRTSGYNESSYKLINNVNLPVLIFIGVIVSLFLGMINSVGEIHKDKRQLKQESYLNLSTLAYLISKIAYILIINLYQIGIYVFISNSIIEINGLFWHYLLVFWVASGVMSMIGLYVSIKLNSILSTYIAIPFILIPQILLAGAILDFDDVHKSVANKKYAPFFADIMVSRWTYEAIVDIQMSENLYSRNYHDLYIKKSSADYCLNILIPKLKTVIETRSDKSLDYNSNEVIQSGINELYNYYNTLPLKDVRADSLTNIELYNLLDRIALWLKEVKSVIREETVKRNATEIFDSDDYENKKLKELVLKRTRYVNYTIDDDEIIRKFEPAYYSSSCKIGRAHLYAPYKMMANLTIKAWQFNLVVLLLMMTVFAFMVLIALQRKYNNK
ncbi:MAG: ATP-binding cassette domain-containing protein [Carboxylicivirga sp.]|jgi:ABC-type multidrug transport system ATPase subunit|nr:ATP-binding cassette domain-containing protein [Carboxylicivirga sp.]